MRKHAPASITLALLLAALALTACGETHACNDGSTGETGLITGACDEHGGAVNATTETNDDAQQANREAADTY